MKTIATAQSAQTRDVVYNYMEALANRDLTKIMRLFAESVDWYIPGNFSRASWLGKRSAKSEIRMFFEDLWSNTKPLTASIQYLFVDDEVAIVVGEFSTKMLPTDQVVDSLFSILIRVQEGLISQYRLLEDSYAVSEALGGSN
ncbi:MULTISPECIES: nuclear transport factor 2 family protein [Olivibacter]|jgi:ketosteroid isomerase-like protein|uniref:Nuclear transport factor 2 family protein n=1 Tax=Olivibacter oleidegradans TaxID=760123 RepID=A0ABV6HNH3_9SPHI|nr:MULTISPECIES: nuclear transport factor 2 family protein [Olivibacter]MDM8173372.1 nuclear transport factor 2 family protein [Olivibacter sp. 47]